MFFLFKNNVVLVEGLVAFILLVVAYLTYRSFKAMGNESGGGSGGGSSADIGHLEDLIKKLLENSGPTQGGGKVATEGGGGSPELEAQVTQLKSEIQAKESEIESLKNAPASEVATPPEEKVQLEGQIKDLKSKLEEFDIISADIADLSLYKEENQKLKKELDELKKSSQSSSPPPAAPVAAPVPEPAPAVPTAPPAAATAPVVEPAIGAMPEPPVASPASATTEESAIQNVVDEDLIKEYAAMVEAQKKAEVLRSGGAPAAPVAPAAPPTNAEAGTTTSPSPDSAEIMDQFEDFAKKKA